VARGEQFLGRGTQKGAVIYLALEEKRSEVRAHFRAMGASGQEEIYVHAAHAPADALPAIAEEMKARKPVLLIIDPLLRFARIKDGNDYAQVTAALEPILILARESGAHVLLVHHLGKGERAEPTDGILTHPNRTDSHELACSGRP
jgi:RecA-family ATPase